MIEVSVIKDNRKVAAEAPQETYKPRFHLPHVQEAVLTVTVWPVHTASSVN